MTTASISWSAHQDPKSQLWFVKETSETTGESNYYGPMKGHVVESFLRARREYVHRQMQSRGGLRLFFN